MNYTSVNDDIGLLFENKQEIVFSRLEPPLSSDSCEHLIIHGNAFKMASLTLWTPGAGIPVLRKLQNGARHWYTGSAQISLRRQKPVYRVCVNL